MAKRPRPPPEKFIIKRPRPPPERRSHCFAWSPIRRLMKQQGASIVARDAVDLLIDHLEKIAIGLTEQAQAFTMHAKRKKITKNDLLLSIKYK
ncbi:unnamed protein product [marine sediment metagenome]|uniref:Transcription factor CBF/NF-Y/archaeal histone domain-containing protein n=1 Tax=marine sediment metagenome TaxID=412755 RepID=X1SU94_9ZZZZ